MRLLLVSSLLGMVVAGAGCTRAATPTQRDAGGSDMGPALDAGSTVDAAMTCTSDPQCNDTFACTLDMCVAGGTCQHTPIDGMCPTGQHCVVGTGCTTGMMAMPCTTAAECDDHVFCNGIEQCLLHMCAPPAAPHNCDDGNACTIDTCDPALDRCAYMMTCDSGVVTTDAGPICTAFTAPGDFNGTYALIPGESQACGGANYDVSQVTLSVSGSTITATTGTIGAIVMTGTMTGSAFTVSGSFGTGTFTLTGSFACRERFMGHWSSVVTGFGCVNENVDVRGSRR